MGEPYENSPELSSSRSFQKARSRACNRFRTLRPYLNVLKNRIQHRLRTAVHTNNIELVHELLNSGEDANQFDSRGRTLLHLAACCGYRDIVKALLKKGANPNALDAIGNTPLHLAVCASHIAVVIDLLDARTDLSLVNRYGRTPLHLAQSKLKLIWEQKQYQSKFQEEVKLIVDMIVTYLRIQNKESDEIEELAQRLQNVSTKEEADTQLSDILKHLEQLNLSTKVTSDVKKLPIT